MAKLKTYTEFVNEALIDAIKNPIKWKKIKNNAKKFQKAKVAQALNDVDYAKRKEKASGELSPKQKEVLTQANKAKNAALKDTSSNISQRMDDLATTDGLKMVAKLAKTKSNLAANKIVLKAADGEEAKRLKVKQTALTKKATAAQTALKDYESETGDKDTGGGDKAKEQISALRKQREPLIDFDDEKDPVKRAANRVKIQEINVKIADLEGEGQAEAKKDLADAKEKLAKATGEPAAEGEPAANDDPGAKLEADIADFNNRIEDERAAMTKAMKDLDQAQRDLKTGRGSEEKVQKLQKSIEDSKEDIAELKNQEAAAKKKLAALPESFEFIDEGMYTADQLTNMLLDDIRKGIRKGIQAPDEKELKTLALKRLKMKRVMKVDIEDTINGWEKSLADARKDKMREKMFSFIKTTKGKIPESFEYVAESVSEKFARLRSNL